MVIECFVSLQFITLVSMLAAGEVVIGVLAYSKSDEVRGKWEELKSTVNILGRSISDHDECFCAFIMKVGSSVAEFYTSLYTLYAASGDPAIAVSLTFFHNAVSIK